MSFARGSDTVVALQQGSTWNTPVAVGAGDGLLILSESLTGGKASLSNDSLNSNWGLAPDPGAEMHTGALRGYWLAGANCGRLLASIMGTSGAPSSGSGTDESHAITLDDVVADFHTFCIRKRGSSVKPWEYASAMAESFALSGSAGERVEWELGLVASSLDRDSSTNTTTEIDAVTVPTVRAAYRNTKVDFRINAQGGSGLGSGDRVKLAGWRFSIVRPLSRDLLAAAADGDTIALPCEDGPSEVMLTVDLRSYDAETWIDAWRAGTEYKFDITLSSGYTPSGGAELTTLIECPRAVLAEEPQAPMSGPGRISHSLTFKCLVASSAPTGMSGLTQPCRATVVDEDSSAYLS